MPDPFESLRRVDLAVEPSAAYRARVRRELIELASELGDASATTPSAGEEEAELEERIMTSLQTQPTDDTARRRIWTAVAAGAVAAALLVAVLVVSSQRRGEDRVDVVDTPSTVIDVSRSTVAPASTAVAAPTTAPGVSLPAATDPAAAGAVSFPGPQFTIALDVIDGVLWALPESGAPLERLATADGTRYEAVPVPPSPSNTTLPAAGFGSLWIARLEEDEVYRVDSTTGAISGPIALPGDIPSVVAPSMAPIVADAAGVQVITWTDGGSSAALVRIDPASGNVAGAVPLPAGATNISAGEGSLWVTTQQDVVRLDAGTGSPVAVIPIAEPLGLDQLQAVRAGEGSVWLHGRRDGTDHVVRIDPATNAVLAVIPVGQSAPASTLKTDIVFAGGAVWTCTSDAGLVRLDPATNQISARYLGTATGGCAITATEDAVWFAPFGARNVYRLPL
jgi:sugar lactone lactonase YvrE